MRVGMVNALLRKENANIAAPDVKCPYTAVESAKNTIGNMVLTS